MPPRHTYWTILVGSSPTAFRAAEREDLVPTFERLRGKHPEVVLKWFARGKLWDSQEAQHDADRAERSATREGPPRDGAWRPGGTHRDPRARVKKKTNDAGPRGRGRSARSVQEETEGRRPSRARSPRRDATRPRESGQTGVGAEGATARSRVICQAALGSERAAARS